MAKRLICLLLCFCMLLPLLPAATATCAEPTLKPMNIVIWDGQQRVLPVYAYVESDSSIHEFLFSVSDLEELSGFEAEITEKEIIFTRGAKIVRVTISNSMLSVMNRSAVGRLDTPLQLIDGEYYLPASTMLSWLNMNCSMKDGVLYLISNPVSFWDIMRDFRISRYGFSLANCAKYMRCSEKALKALAYIENSFSGKVVDGISGLQTEQEYYDLFYDFILDQTASQQTVDFIKSFTELHSNMGNLSEYLDSSLGLETSDEIADIFKVDLALGLDIVSFSLVYYQDNTAKIALLDALIDNYSSKKATEYSPIVAAAEQVKISCEKYLAGLTFTIGYEIVERLSDLNYLSIMDWLDIDHLRQLSASDLQKRFAGYEKLSDMAYDLYIDKMYDYQNIFDIEALVMLYLYGVEQRYRAMAEHAADLYSADDYAVQVFNEYADTIEDQYALFLAASVYADFDTIDLDVRSNMAREIQRLFRDVEYQEPVSGVGVAAEQRIFYTVALGSAAEDRQWTLLDLDGDGTDELFAIAPIGSGNTPGYIVLDGNLLGAFPLTSGSHTTALQRDSYGKYYLYSMQTESFAEGEIIPGGEMLEEFYVWTNAGWTVAASAHHDPIYENHEGPLEYEKTFTIAGAAATEDAYNQYIRSLRLSTVFDPRFDDPSLQTLSYPGDPAALMEQFDDYLCSRSGFVEMESNDLNGDGCADRVYLIYDPDSLYRQAAQCPYSNGVDSLFDPAQGTAMLFTVVSAKDSVHLRAMNIHMPMELLGTNYSVMRFRDSYLVVGDQHYSYQSRIDAAPFTRALDDTSLGQPLIGMDFTQLYTATTDYREWPNGSKAFCVRDGYPVTVSYDEANRVASAEFTECYLSGFSLVPELYQGMPSAEYSIFANQVAQPSEPEDVPDPVANRTLSSSTTYWYHEDHDRFYAVTVYFDKKSATLLFADAVLMDEGRDFFKNIKYGTIPSATPQDPLDMVITPPDTEYLLQLCKLTYRELYERFWASAYSSPDIYGNGSDAWNYACMLGEAGSIVFEFASEYEDPNTIPIFARIDAFSAYSGAVEGMALCPGVNMGMTYQEVSKALELSELENAAVGGHEMTYVCYSSAMGCALDLYFVGSSEKDAVLTWVEVGTIG